MLEELGIPIVTTQGRYGGYQVVPGFKLPPMIFSDQEALALAVGLMAARGLGLAESMPAVASARAKMERVFPLKLKQRLRAVDESIALELARPVAVIDQQVLGLLCTATQEHRRVRMAYQSRGEAHTEREFDPYGLVYRAGRWYIVGWCHLRRGLREVIAAAGPAHARHERGAAQLAEQLLEVGQRNVLALADRGERHRAAVLPQRQIDHRSDREPSLRSESHDGSNTRLMWSSIP